MLILLRFSHWSNNLLNLSENCLLHQCSSECRLRDSLRAACSRAEVAEAARDAANRSAVEARNNAAAATASATQAATLLATAQEQITGLKIQLELSERQRNLFEERFSEISTKMISVERELHELRPLQALQNTLQRQYAELQERTSNATEDARREASRLESELRRVERCAAAGTEIRERARLAAAAHAREKRLVAAELQQTTQELHTANAEITRLGTMVTELQLRLLNSNNTIEKTTKARDDETVSELRETLKAERAGVEKLERALTAALADNATLAAIVHSNDNSHIPSKTSSTPPVYFVSPIDDFLAE